MDVDVDEMGEVSRFLRLEISRDWAAGEIRVRASGYCRFMLDKFGFASCAPAQSPGYGGKVPDVDMASRKVDAERFRSKVGSLLYLAGTVRPDISAEVNMCAQHSVTPDVEADARVDRIMKFVSGTIEKGLVFRRGSLKVDV